MYVHSGRKIEKIRQCQILLFEIFSSPSIRPLEITLFFNFRSYLLASLIGFFRPLSLPSFGLLCIFKNVDTEGKKIDISYTLQCFLSTKQIIRILWTKIESVYSCT